VNKKDILEQRILFFFFSLINVTEQRPSSEASVKQEIYRSQKNTPIIQIKPVHILHLLIEDHF